ncbi:MAG: hypothetical protein K0S25_1369 [Bacillus sp. (in: firmicutes)]|jgi:DNA-binding transcriptional MerR regulator|nr:hypothetical protein [Bacillus sp. (in: firmicutes)]
MKSPYLKTYTIQEASKLINVPTGTIKRWEKDLSEFINIPRTKQGARFFSENEITLLKEIKLLRDNNTSLGKIAEIFKIQSGTDLTVPVEEKIKIEEVETSIITVSSPPQVETKESPNLEDFFRIMDVYKENLLDEVKTEIRTGIRKEVLEEVKKEISKGSVQTVKSLSRSIYKLGENSKSEIQELSNIMMESSENTSETLESLSKNLLHASDHTSKTVESLTTRIAKVSENTSKTLETISNGFMQASEHASKTLETISTSFVQATDDTKYEISHLVDSLNKDRELYIETLQEERKHFTKEIRSREATFQNLVTTFRNTAVGKEHQENRKWWKFW